jgi:hypothetical protein
LPRAFGVDNSGRVAVQGDKAEKPMSSEEIKR